VILPNDDEPAPEEQSSEPWPSSPYSSPYQETCDALRAFRDWNPTSQISQLDDLEDLSAQPDPLRCDGEEGVEGQENEKMLGVPLPDSDHGQGLSETRSPLPRSLSLSPSASHQGSSHRRGISTQWERDRARKKAAAVLKQIHLLSSLQASLTRKHRKLVLISRLQD